MEFIKHSTRHEEIEYRLYFESKTTRGWGYAFDCDAAGTVNPDALNHAARASWDKVHSDPDFYPPVVETHTHRWTEPAEIRCGCGAAVVLADCMTNDCGRCGQFYNGSGQRLAHPSQWGEETGERFTDSGAEVL